MQIKILTVVGARPQFIKAAMLSRAIKAHNESAPGCAVEEVIIHTGQPYDANRSETFFADLGIPRPAANLGVGSGTHGETTGAMLALLEAEILRRSPDAAMVYGDTNSTAAGALAAAKLNIPVIHVEAGLRSHNRGMPEELNRVLTDHLSSILLCPTRIAEFNLKAEGITEGIHHVGDVMIDAARVFGRLAHSRSSVLEDLRLKNRKYFLATVHRAENTDDPAKLGGILGALEQIATWDCPVIIPLHPRTRTRLRSMKNPLGRDWSRLELSHSEVRLVPPVSYFDMIMLEKHARLILTDSGGVQKEAYFHGVPCITLREETEWVETLRAGWNQLAGCDANRIIRAVRHASPGQMIEEYGTGYAAELAVGKILDVLGKGADLPLKAAS